MQKGKIELTQKDAENTPAGGVVVGKRDGQTMIYDDASLGGYFIGKLHRDGGIKMINKSTGQPLEVQGSEIIITAPAVNDPTKHNFDGQMMTNREILSKINSDGGGVSFAEGGDIPAKIHTTDKEYEYGGKMVHDSDIAHSLGMNSTLKKGKQHFSSGGKTYDVDSIYNAIKKSKISYITKDIEPFAMKYPVYDKKYSETVKIDLRKPNGIMIKSENGEDVLIDGNHRVNNAYLNGRKKIKVYYIFDLKQIAKFTKKNKFEIGGKFDTKPFLDYYFEEIKDFLKYQNDIKLKDDYTFFYRGENFRIEPLILSDKEKEESLQEAIFTIIDQDDEDVGEIKFDANSKNKKNFEAYSDFFEWNNIKFDEGGSVSKENELVFEKKSDRLKSFYKTNNPSIDKLLIDCQPFIAELIDKQKKLVLERTLKINGVATPMDELDVEYYEIGLLFKMVQSFNKYLKVTDVLSDAKIKKHSDLFEISATVTRDGRKYSFYTELIPAGGYNIQEFHYRYITKTDLPESGENSAVENLKSKNTTLNKIKSIDLDIQRISNAIARDEEKLKKGFEILNGREYVLKQDSINRYKSYIKDFYKDIDKLKTKKTDLESVFGSLEKKGVGVNFGKEIKEVIGRKLLIDKLRASKYKETGDSLEFKIETRSIRGERISENTYRTLGQVNTFTFVDEGNGLCSIKAGLELRGKYTLYAELKNVPISDVRLKINEIFEGEFEKYLKNGGDVDSRHNRKENLVKDAEDGNTPARDLNNYNDLLDVQADGAVGGDSGIFADGGGVGLPKVAYVKVFNSGASLSTLIGNKYNSYIEFAESVKNAYIKLGKVVRSYVSLDAFSQNDEKLIDVSSYISNQKNTIKNFNPLTGNYKNLEKSLANSRPRSFQKFDWNDWLLSKVKTPTQMPTSTSNQSLDLSNTKVWIGDDKILSKEIQEVAFELGWRWSNYPNVVKNVDLDSLYFDASKYITYNIDDRTYFDKNDKKEINPQDILLAKKAIVTTSSSSSASSKPFDFTDTKIDVGNRPELKLKVQKRAFELGWEWENGGGKTYDYDDFNYLYFTKKSISNGFTPSSFVNSPKREITEDEIFGSQNSNVLNYPEYYEFINVTKSSDFTKGKIYKIINPKDLTAMGNFIDNSGVRNGYGINNYKYFKPSTEEAFLAQQSGSYNSSTTSSTTSYTASSSSNKDVQTVLVTYSGGQTYTALNEEKLLNKIVELWKTGGRSKMSIILQPQGFVTTLSSPVNVLLDTIKTSKESIQPSSLSIAELREYLSRDWYPELDWSDFFKEIKNTVGNSVNSDGKINQFKIDVKEASISNWEVDNINQLFQFLDSVKDYDSVILFKYKTKKGGQKEFGAYFRIMPIEYYFLRKDNFNIEYLKEKLNEWFPNLISDSFFETQNTKPLLTDLSNTKIQIIDPEMFKKVQERAFELGWYWSGDRGQKKQQTILTKYLFFWGDKEITKSNELVVFKASGFKEIFAGDLFYDALPYQNTVSNEKDVVKTITARNGSNRGTFYDIYQLRDFIEIVAEDNKDSLANGSTMRLYLDINDVVQNDFIINIGKNVACGTCYDVLTEGVRRIKQIILAWDEDKKWDWSKFFDEAKTTSKSAVPKIKEVTSVLLETANDKRNFFKSQDLFREIQLLQKNKIDAKIFVNGEESFNNIAYLYLSDKDPVYDYNDMKISEFEDILSDIIINGDYDWSKFFDEAKTTSKSVVPKTKEVEYYDLKEAVKVLEKASSSVATEYNKESYNESLNFLYDTKRSYELALKFTPESAFMYERLDLINKLADIEKGIKSIEDMKNGGTFYILAKILERLERGENWKSSELAQDVITNQIPKLEIDIIIRSQKFKNWFGDWEKAILNNEYDNVSKALTDGMPSVYHHGARRIKYTYREVSNGVLYLAENISYALWFSQNSTAQTEEGNYLTECFVNIKNPIDLTPFHVEKVDLADIVQYVDAVYPMAKIYDFIPSQIALLIKTNQPTNIKMWAWQLIRSYVKFVNHIKENTPYDGFLYYENNPSDQVFNSKTGQYEENITKAVAIFKSHQVKVVDAILFDGGLDDWRFENGGKLNN